MELGAPTKEERPLLLFFARRQSGPARRMASLIAWVTVKHKQRLRVVEVDIEEACELANALHVESAPALVLVRGNVILDRLDGRATGPEIERFLAPHIVPTHH
jgi:thioredoxin-like negative regulator of GroEL